MRRLTVSTDPILYKPMNPYGIFNQVGDFEDKFFSNTEKFMKRKPEFWSKLILNMYLNGDKFI